MESEISTLKSVLDAKVRQANELKYRLGRTPIAELRRDIQHGVETIRTSESLVQFILLLSCQSVFFK